MLLLLLLFAAKNELEIKPKEFSVVFSVFLCYMSAVTSNATYWGAESDIAYKKQQPVEGLVFCSRTLAQRPQIETVMISRVQVCLVCRLGSLLCPHFSEPDGQHQRRASLPKHVGIHWYLCLKNQR